MIIAETWMDWVRKVNLDTPICLKFLRSHPATAPLEAAKVAVQKLWAYLWLSDRLPTSFPLADEAQGASRMEGKVAWHRPAPKLQ